jgi:hypothetical protein
MPGSGVWRGRRLLAAEGWQELQSVVVRQWASRNRIAIGTVLAVVVSLVVVVVVVVVVAGRDGRRPAASTDGTPQLPAFDATTARPAEETWPEAVVRLPRYLPDGRQSAAVARLDEDRFVIAPSGGNYSELPVVYDARSGKVTDLITERHSPDTPIQRPAVSVSDRDIILAVQRIGAGGDLPAEVWVAPRSGGPAVRRAEFENATSVSAFGVGNEVFAVVSTKTPAVVTTVYRLPGGGPPEQVTRAEGVPESRYGRWLMTKPRAVAVPPSEPGPFTFVDVVTGESRTTTHLDGLEKVVCSPETCAGYEGADLVAYRFDGSGPARLTGLTLPARRFDRHIVEGGRFIALGGGDDAYLWDRQRNVAGAMLAGPEIGQLQQIRYSADHLYLLDLSRIP